MSIVVLILNVNYNDRKTKPGDLFSRLDTYYLIKCCELIDNLL